MKRTTFACAAALLLAGCSNNSPSDDDVDDVSDDTTVDDVSDDATIDDATIDDTTVDVPTDDTTEDSARDVSDVAVDAQPSCDEPVTVIELGLVSLGDDGISDELSFVRSACGTAFVIEIEGPDEVMFLVNTLTAPDGTGLVQDDIVVNDPILNLLTPFPSQFESPNRVGATAGVGMATVPSSSGVVVEPGTYRFTVRGATLNDQGPEPYDGEVSVRVLYKTVDTHTTGGVLPINLYLSGAGGLTAQSAPSDPLLQDALTNLATIYGVVDLQLGEVSYYDIDTRFQTVTSIDGRDNDLSAMFRETAGNPDGLNYFIVDRFEIEGVPGGSIGGISGGVPGPALHAGSGRSGVAIALTAAGDSAETLAHLMGHEGGHYLGLFHIVEFFPGIEDTLDDTPADQRAESMLMYPSVGGDTTLSPEQGRIMHNHPEVTQ